MVIYYFLISVFIYLVIIFYYIYFIIYISKTPDYDKPARKILLAISYFLLISLIIKVIFSVVTIFKNPWLKIFSIIIDIILIIELIEKIRVLTMERLFYDLEVDFKKIVNYNKLIVMSAILIALIVAQLIFNVVIFVIENKEKSLKNIEFLPSV